jgi:hypothetical protein
MCYENFNYSHCKHNFILKKKKALNLKNKVEFGLSILAFPVIL